MQIAKTRKRAPILVLLQAVSILLLCCLFGSCVDDDHEPVTIDKVLLVYLAGDNNLSGEAQDKLVAISNGYQGAACRRVLIYRDGTSQTPSLMELDERGDLVTLEDYAAENSADPHVFSRVILKAKSMYPAARFNLLVFSHATGWLPKGSYTNPAQRSILVDGQEEMELSEFASAIPDHSFETIIFEACHMAGIEVGYELRNKAKYIVGSSAEIVSPGFTDVYSQTINQLVEGDPQVFIQNTFDWFNQQAGYRRSASFSIIRTDKLDALASFVKGNCDFTTAIQPHDIQHFDRKSQHLFYDFEDYHSRLLATPAQQESLKTLLDACVVWKAATPSFMLDYGGFYIQKHSGMTAYIMQDKYPKLNASYKATAWYRAIDRNSQAVIVQAKDILR